MRIINTSDWHGDRETLGVPRTEEVAHAVRASVTHAIDVNADLYVFTGDVGDPDSRGGTWRAVDMMIEAALALAKHRIRSIWVAGNHDVEEDGSGASCLSPLAAIERAGGDDGYINVVEHPRMLGLDEERDALCLPFTPVSHAYDPDAVARKLLANQKPHLHTMVLAHLMIPGVIIGEETTEMPRGRDIVFPVEATRACSLRINGHYHQRQTTREGILVPGALARFHFGHDEKAEPGFLDIEW